MRFGRQGCAVFDPRRRSSLIQSLGKICSTTFNSPPCVLAVTCWRVAATGRAIGAPKHFESFRSTGIADIIQLASFQPHSPPICERARRRDATSKMSTILTTATTTSGAAAELGQAIFRGERSASIANDTSSPTPALKSLSLERKYSHAAAAHSALRTSCLSAGAEKTPSFVGFRNLMILMLSESHPEPNSSVDADRRLQSCPTCG